MLAEAEAEVAAETGAGAHWRALAATVPLDAIEAIEVGNEVCVTCD